MSASRGGDDRSRRPGGRMLLFSEMLGWKVVDAQGRKLGKLTELEVIPRSGYEVRAMIVGRSTFLSRLAAGESLDNPLERHLQKGEQLIPWSAVARIEEGRITVDESKIDEDDGAADSGENGSRG
jgi:sporulation protein YlmC with PRC-barrel domain